MAGKTPVGREWCAIRFLGLDNEPLAEPVAEMLAGLASADGSVSLHDERRGPCVTIIVPRVPDSRTLSYPLHAIPASPRTGAMTGALPTWWDRRGARGCARYRSQAYHMIVPSSYCTLLPSRAVVNERKITPCLPGSSETSPRHGDWPAAIRDDNALPCGGPAPGVR